MIGSSAQLIEKILDAHQALGLDRFFGQIDWGGLPKTLVEDSINRARRLSIEATVRLRGRVS